MPSCQGTFSMTFGPGGFGSALGAFRLTEIKQHSYTASLPQRTAEHTPNGFQHAIEVQERDNC